MPGYNGGVGGERSQPLRPAASAPSLLGSWPQKLAGLEGTRGRDGDSAPGTLTRGPALHAPAAARGHRAPRAAPSRPSSPGHPPGHCSEHPPRSPPSVALYGSFKAAAATRAAAAFDGDKAAKAAGEAPARPALARPGPARPRPPPGSLGPGRAARRSAQRARLAHQSKLSRPEGEHGARPLPLQQHPSRHLPQTLRQTGWEESNSQAPSPGWGGGEREKGEGKGKGGSFSSFSLLAAPPAQAGK